MKVLILVVCALAAASAGWAPVSYHGAQHVPVIHNGVPVETPEVQHAKAAHFAALAEASARAGYEHYEDNNKYDEYEGHDFHGNNYGYAVAQEVPTHYYSTAIVTKPAYETSHVLPAIGHDGKPLDTPEVEAAKAHHFAAVQKALIQSGSHGVQHHYRKRRGLYANHATNGYSVHQVHAPVYGHHDSYNYEFQGIDHEGRPLDTPEVAHAKAAHTIAYHEAAARNSHPVYAGSHSYGFQGIDYKGRPLDTPEVAHAKAAHFVAYHEAAARNSQPIYAEHQAYGYQQGPVDTVEVQYAKAKHFAAHQEALSRNTHATHGYNYVQAPIDTVEVQHAKALHFAAHAAANKYHY